MHPALYRSALFAVIIFCCLVLWLRLVERGLPGLSTNGTIPKYLVETRSRHFAYHVFNNTTTALQKPLPAKGDKVIVMGKLSTEDTEWLALLPDWDHAVYVVNDTSAPLHTQQNKGREANAYLTYIIDNYPNFPETMVFIHSHRNGNPAAWHTEAPNNDIVNGLDVLNLSAVQEEGYVNLRCTPEPGCDGDMIQPWRYVNDRRPLILEHATSDAFMEAWPRLFRSDEADVPEQIGAPCCAQFAVSREQVLMRPLHDYIWYHQWLLETKLSDAISGRVMEYSWHVIFGKKAVQYESLRCGMAAGLLMCTQLSGHDKVLQESVSKRIDSRWTRVDPVISECVLMNDCSLTDRLKSIYTKHSQQLEMISQANRQHDIEATLTVQLNARSGFPSQCTSSKCKEGCVNSHSIGRSNETVRPEVYWYCTSSRGKRYVNCRSSARAQWNSQARSSFIVQVLQKQGRVYSTA